MPFVIMKLIGHQQPNYHRTMKIHTAILHEIIIFKLKPVSALISGLLINYNEKCLRAMKKLSLAQLIAKIVARIFHTFCDIINKKFMRD